MTATVPGTPVAAGPGAANALEARGVVKAFPGVLANNDVSFDLRVGEVHAVLGENGAGKSTLMNVLAGLYRPDSGEILIDGRAVVFNSPRDAIAAGVGMVHQHFTLVPSQTVTENVILGLDSPRFLLRTSRAEAKVGQLAAQFGLRVDPAPRSGSCRSVSNSGWRSSSCSIAAPGFSSWTSRQPSSPRRRSTSCSGRCAR